MILELPWPPSILSAHANTNNRWAKIKATKQHREWAYLGTKAAVQTPLPDSGDIRLVVTFYPPNRRGDRTNYASRIKAQIDGIADALGVNDRRFHPSYHYAEPVDNARVVYVIGEDQ